MWNLDLAFADVVATTTQPALGAIRMAWWRERLEELDKGADAPSEPRLQRVRRELIGRDVSGAELMKLEDCWLPMLEPFPWGRQTAKGFRERGRLLFSLGAHLLGGEPEQAAAAGALWSLADGAKHCSDAESRDYLLSEAREALAEVPERLPAIIRPLTILAALAAFDLRPGGRFGRVGAAFAHRLRGSVRHG